MADNVQDDRRKPGQEIIAIHRRLDEGDARMASIEGALVENTALTRQVVENTAGFVAFSQDLEGGTRLLCRVAKGIQFLLKDVIDPYWKPALIVFVAIYWVTNDHALPDWLALLASRVLGL